MSGTNWQHDPNIRAAVKDMEDDQEEALQEMAAEEDMWEDQFTDWQPYGPFDHLHLPGGITLDRAPLYEDFNEWDDHYYGDDLIEPGELDAQHELDQQFDRATNVGLWS